MALKKANAKEWRLYTAWHSGTPDSVELSDPVAFHTRDEALELLAALEEEKAKAGKIPWFATVMGPRCSEVIKRNPVTFKDGQHC